MRVVTNFAEVGRSMDLVRTGTTGEMLPSSDPLVDDVSKAVGMLIGGP